MPKLGSDGAPNPTLETALEYAAKGWHVFPLLPNKKPLAGSHGHLDATTDPEQIREWWKDYPRRNIGIATGASGLVVIDIDVDPENDKDGTDDWRFARAHHDDADTLRATSPRGGEHWYYHKGDRPVKSRNAWRPAIDVKADGGYVVAPSPAATGGRTWAEGPVEPQPLPPWLEDLLSTSKAGNGDVSDRQSLPALRADPPARGSGRTNDWLVRIAGHHALRHRGDKNAYLEACQDDMALVDPGYEDFEKTVESVWAAEQKKKPADLTHSENGWLIGSAGRMWCRMRTGGTKDDPVYDVVEWSNFDLTAEGVAIQEDGENRTYFVRVTAPGSWADGKTFPLSTAVATADGKALDKWLNGKSLRIFAPDAQMGKGRTIPRLLAYLDWQNPPEGLAVGHYGWVGDRLILDEGELIPGETAVRPYTDIRPVVRPDWAPYHYGFEGTREESIDVLREVLTYHDEEYVAVFAAWWAACWVKPLLGRKIFPYMRIESPSGHSKTSGFNSMMVQLSGRVAGPGIGTVASIRDFLTASNIGMVWVDDPDDRFVAEFQTHLRSLTIGGGASKKGEDNTGTEGATLRAPFLMSGEMFPALNSQKAQNERSIQLSPPDPKNRMSLHDPERIQWADIVALQKRFPDELGMTTIAGHLCSVFTQEGIWLLEEAPPAILTGGRFHDKMSTLFFGAELLSRVTGDDRWKRASIAWADRQLPTDEDALTNQILVEALRSFIEVPDQVSTPAGNDFNWVVVSAKTGLIEYHPGSLIKWWNRFVRDQGTADRHRKWDETSLREQGLALGGRRIKRNRNVGGWPDVKMVEIPAEYTRRVLDRVAGGTAEPEPAGGVLPGDEAPAEDDDHWWALAHIYGGQGEL